MGKTKETYTLIGPLSQVATMDHVPPKGPIDDDQLQVIEKAGILIKGERIHRIGNFKELKKETSFLQPETFDPEGNFVCLPGFVDAHTHICFAGNRSADYALRNTGTSYLEIAKKGGGIMDTVRHTRNASEEDLVEGVLLRAGRHLLQGVTTIEVKSGYGLTVADELKMLRAIKRANEKSPTDLVATCLAAHVVPADYKGNEVAYLQEIADNLLPLLKKEALANRIDAFVEEGAFSAKAITKYFEKARDMGFDITVHADQFTPSGSRLAVQVGAISADHLEASGEDEIKMLSESNVIATVLPGASMGLGMSFAPARKLLDAGCAVAIASDWNPGSAPMGNLLVQASVLGAFQKLSNAEVLAGITCRAASALGLPDRGSLSEGNPADFSLFPTDNFNDVFYYQGSMGPAFVWKKGRKFQPFKGLEPLKGWNK